MIPTCRPMMVRQRHPRLNDYLSRLTALGGSLSGDRINALQTLFNGLWTDGLITGNAAVNSSDILQFFNAFPMAAGSAIAQVLEPTCRPTGTTGTNTGYVDADYTSNGLTSSGTKRYSAGFTPSAVMQTDSAHLCVYLTNYTGTTTYRTFGVLAPSGTNQTLIYYSGNNDCGAHFHSSNVELYRSGLTFSTKTFIVSSRLSGTVNTTINGNNGARSVSDSTTPRNDINVHFGNTNVGGDPLIDGQGWWSCGLGMTTTQHANLRTRVTNFNTAIGR